MDPGSAPRQRGLVMLAKAEKVLADLGPALDKIPKHQRYRYGAERKSAELGLRFSKLSIHRASQGINYLGYRIWPTHRLLRKRAIVRFRRDAKRIARHIEEGRATRHDMLRRMQSFYAYAKHADTHRLRRKLFAECVTLVREAERSRAGIAAEARAEIER